MLRATLLLLALALAPATSRAETWPERPLRLVVPFPPGGITDSIGRLTAEWLARRLNATVLVENRSGGGGVIAADHVLASRADGHNLLMGGSQLLTMLPALTPLSFDPQRDFAAVSLVASNPLILTVTPGLGVDSVQDLVTYVRARPGLAYGSGGVGASTHLAMAVLVHEAGLEMQHVPYRGTGAAMADLLAGRIPVMFTNTSDVLPYRGDPRLKLLAVTGSTPASAFPTLPVLAGTGLLEVPVDTWNGLVVAAATPPAIIARLSAALTPACADLGFRRALAQLGTDPVCNSPAEFAAGIRDATTTWRDAVRRTGASIN